MNPWFEVPLADYEAHMTSDAVDQLSVLSALFASVLELYKPASVALLGVAGGNGLERINTEQTRRVVGVDLNPEYADAVRARFSAMPGLELYVADLAEEVLALEPVDLVHAALIFEHAGVELCIENAIALTAPGGALAVVLQRTGAEGAHVGNSGVASVARFAGHFSEVDPVRFTGMLTARGLRLVHESTTPVPAGKQFWLGVFERV
jgi:hypothetical protein